MTKKCIDLCILMIKMPNFLCCKLFRANCIVRDVFNLQKAGVDVDTRLILDEGELAIHWSQNFIYGGLDQARL